MALIIILVILALLVIYVIGAYNSLVKARNTSNAAWAQIETQLQKRFDLIPNIVETVKGYAKHESSTLQAVTDARTAVQKAQSTHDVDDMVKAGSQVGMAFNAVQEAYPELKANANFLSLQETLEHTEESIAAARRGYNNAATDYNNTIQIFPKNIIANMFGYKPSKLFAVETEEASKAPKVSF